MSTKDERIAELEANVASLTKRLISAHRGYAYSNTEVAALEVETARALRIAAAWDKAYKEDSSIALYWPCNELFFASLEPSELEALLEEAELEKRREQWNIENDIALERGREGDDD
jgi:hypothetical protein